MGVPVDVGVAAVGTVANATASGGHACLLLLLLPGGGGSSCCSRSCCYGIVIRQPRW
jgi:hypothetical protein